MHVCCSMILRAMQDETVPSQGSLLSKKGFHNNLRNGFDNWCQLHFPLSSSK